MARYLYSELSSLIQARSNCEKQMLATDHATRPHIASTNQAMWFEQHTDRIESLVREHMPSGSGFDSGSKLDLGASKADKLVFTTAYHHMSESGMYDGWTEHTVTVTPSLSHGFNMRVSGRNRNEIKDLIHESFDYALMTDLTDQFEYERLAPVYGLTYKSHWLDGCTQKWNVYGPIGSDTEVLIKSAFDSWMAARHFAVEYMQAIENTGKGI